MNTPLVSTPTPVEEGLSLETVLKRGERPVNCACVTASLP